MLKFSQEAEGGWLIGLGLSAENVRLLRDGKAIQFSSGEVGLGEGVFVVCDAGDPELEGYRAHRESGAARALLVLEDGDFETLERGEPYERELGDLGADRDGRVLVFSGRTEEEMLAALGEHFTIESVTRAEPGKPKAKKKKKRKLDSSAEPAANDTGASAKKDDAKKDDAKKGSAEKNRPKKELPGAGTPEGERLRQAERAFDAGNYALVRALARELEGAADPAVRDAASEIARRTSVDPVQIVVIVACAAILATIVYVWIL